MDIANLDTEGLPPHMVRSVPHVASVTVEQDLNTHLRCEREVGIDSWMTREDGVNVYMMHHTVQLERDGQLLTRADTLPRWSAGEKGDYRW